LLELHIYYSGSLIVRHHRLPNFHQYVIQDILEQLCCTNPDSLRTVVWHARASWQVL